MTFLVEDRVQETTNSPGTGVVTLLGAVSGFQSFSTGIGANNTTFYVIADQLGTNWEVGLGALNSTGTVLTRTTVYSSSNGGSTVNFATGTQYVWCDYPSSKAVIQGTAVNFSSIGATTAGTGAFTTLSASSTVSGAGFSNYFAAPPTIGNTTPNAGTFTDSAYTGTLTGGTGVVNLGSGQFYKDASGNVGIGTSSPAKQLQITNSTYAQMRINPNSAYAGIIEFVDSASTTNARILGWGSTNATPNALSFDTNGTERMRITSAGNLGLGVTPSTSSQVTFEIGAVGNVITTNGTNDIQFTAGGYYNGSWKYAVTSSPVSSYYQDSGNHVWRYSASGTAGNAITWSEAMRIDTSGNVGIGGSPASEWASSTLLQLNTASTYSTFSLASTRTPVDGNRIGSIAWDLPNNTSTYKTRAVIEGLCSGSTANKFGGSIVFSTATDNTTYPTERMRLNSTGALVLAGGTTTATGVGIAFPATQSASSDANTLDDYEEGTWTPNDASGAGLSFTINSANYVKVGRLVFVYMFITFPVTSNTASIQIGGLPFTSLNASNQNFEICARYQGGSVIPPLGQIGTNSTTISLVPQYNFGGTSFPNATLSNLGLIFSGCYQSN